MIKKITLFLLLLVSIQSFSATPVLNGINDASDGWGTPIGVGDNTAGWAGVNAKNFYFTQDANYYYFAAECSASNWMTFGLIINTTTGGGSTDGWNRKIAYNHLSKPDYEIRGNLDGGYMELHTWNTTTNSWNYGSNVNAAGTEFVESFNTGSNSDGFMELRIPVSAINGGISVLGNVQFYISGNNDDHGSFDAIPNDNNANGWGPPDSQSNLSNYIDNVTLSNRFQKFNLSKFNNSVTLNWQINCSSSQVSFDIEKSTNGKDFEKIGTITASNLDCSKPQNFNDLSKVDSKIFYRIAVTELQGKKYYSNVNIIFGDVKGYEISNVLPNVAESKINLSVSSNAISQTNLVILNQNGSVVYTRKLLTEKGNINVSLDITRFAAGIHYIYLNGELGKTNITKFLKL